MQTTSMPAYWGKPNKPNFYYTEPSKRITLIAKVSIPIYKKFLVPKGTEYIELDACYEDETDVEFHGEERDNPNYDRELQVFNDAKKKYDAEVKDWEEKCRQIDIKNEEYDRKRYEELKAKFGG